MEALFTGAEMVLLRADPHKLNERARRGERGAEIALELLARPEHTISTTLTGTNLFVVLSTVIAMSRFLPRFGERAEILAVAVITPLVILFGEIVPKSFAQARADALSGAAARFVKYAGLALYPLVACASFIARLIARPFGGVQPVHGMVTRDELRLILQLSRGGTDVEPHERVMVRRAFSFGEKKVADIFRPLARIVALPEDATCRDAALVASRSGYSRYPVYRERIDRVVGFLHVLDTVGLPLESPIHPLLRKPLFVAELMPIDELMRKFREARSTFAVAVDEFGGVTGLVTAEDVVEEIVGEIEDEYDRGMEYYRKIGPDTYVVPGSLETRRLTEELGVRFPEGEYSTMGGMLVALAGRIPVSGEKFVLPGLELSVVRATERAVKEVRVSIGRPGEDGALPGEGRGEEPEATTGTAPGKETG
jgi:CBS domain containing-hemolysin-like protein